MILSLAKSEVVPIWDIPTIVPHADDHQSTKICFMPLNCAGLVVFQHYSSLTMLDSSTTTSPMQFSYPARAIRHFRLWAHSAINSEIDYTRSPICWSANIIPEIPSSSIVGRIRGFARNWPICACVCIRATLSMRCGWMHSALVRTLFIRLNLRLVGELVVYIFRKWCW